MNFKQGDKVRLTENVLHEEFRGLLGTVKKTVKSRGVIEIQCENGKPYRAFPQNVELLETEKPQAVTRS